ncbi:maleylacetate reductase [Brevundimonas guildfordensis]|uniref:Maleylacetate reductase n=1 Tax=Brevundimonas guildfordensis TaxID=2762241 RepID=A0ABR8QWZ2_9CAUL|nr:maleylacetate reductase [Brevundimonas guildfordensis]MBD7939959.1 maleylacetate reductase [Brevundimonas guildfordensis]
MQAFTYESRPGRVVFGEGSLKGVAEEVRRLGLERVVVVSGAELRPLADEVAGLIGQTCAGVIAEAVMHTPVAVTEAVLMQVQRLEADGLVAIGGGSSIGLAKAVALRTDLPQIAIPTTYAGSEMTPVIGETKDGAKVTQTTPKVLPEVVIYDANLTLGLAVGISVTSGINAIAHAVEALYARDRNPIIDLMAREGIRALFEALPTIAGNPADRAARAKAQYGAWMCGMCLAGAGMALHHKLCHTLGGSYGLPHAETHTVILPHALAYNAPAVPEAMAALRLATGSDDPALALQELSRKAGGPVRLSDLGLAEADIDGAVERALANPYWNPRPLEAGPLRETLRRAFAGEAPVSP